MHKFQIKALNVIANMIIIIAFIISSMFIGFNQADSKDSNKKNSSSSSSGILLGNTAGNIGISSVELKLKNKNSKHVAINNHTTATETQTKIEQNFYYTQNCNKLEQSSLGNSSNNNRNYNNMTMTTNRTLVAKINETIKNLQQSTAGGNSTSASLAVVRHLSCHKHKRASWSSVNHKRIVGNQDGTVSEVKPSSGFAHETADGMAFDGRVRSQFMARQRRQSRGKRFIIFDGGGVLKLVLGTSFPVKLVDRKRSVTLINNLQALYTPPPTSIYWWSFVNTTTFAARQMPVAATAKTLPEDASRAFIYAAIEIMLESNGLPGNACLLKAICMQAQQPLDGNSSIFHALLNAILTPAATNIDTKYLHAQSAGRYGVDCAQTFNECPKNIGWLKGVRILERN